VFLFANVSVSFVGNQSAQRGKIGSKYYGTDWVRVGFLGSANFGKERRFVRGSGAVTTRRIILLISEERKKILGLKSGGVLGFGGARYLLILLVQGLAWMYWMQSLHYFDRGVRSCHDIVSLMWLGR
jgi:hypothetical protein